jgi:hypothetical protein
MSCFIVLIDQPDLHENSLASVTGEYEKVRLPTHYGLYYTELSFVWIFDSLEETSYFMGFLRGKFSGEFVFYYQLAAPKQEKEILLIASVPKMNKDAINEAVASFVPFTLPCDTGNLRKVNDSSDPFVWISPTKKLLSIGKES